jgi:hypothetical protein
LRGDRVQARCRRTGDLNRSLRRRCRDRRRSERRARGVRCRRCRPGTTRVIPGIWQPPQQVGGGGLRPQAGHELLDLVLRSPGSTIEDLGEMCLVEHVTELDEGREVQSSIGQIVGHQGKPGQQPRRRGPAESGCLGHAQELGAKREERAIAEREDRLAPIELGQATETLDEQPPLLSADLEQPAGERLIRKVGEDHHDPCTRRFSDLPTRTRQLEAARIQACPRTTPQPEPALPTHACSRSAPSPGAARDHRSANHSIRVKRNRRR